jgi:CubicO group peptidase (beta-lactamase class C family)
MTNTAPTQADAARVNPRSSAVSPTPQWATTFAQIGSTTGGYAWVALLNGVCVSQDGVGNAQMPVAGASAVAWTQDTLCNLASVSKTITATAIFMLIQQGLIKSVNELVFPFIDSYIEKTYPDYKPLPGFETITIAELLNMTSRLMPNGWVEDAPLDYPGGPSSFHQLVHPELWDRSNADLPLFECQLCHPASSRRCIDRWLRGICSGQYFWSDVHR